MNHPHDVIRHLKPNGSAFEMYKKYVKKGEFDELDLNCFFLFSLIYDDRKSVFSFVLDGFEDFEPERRNVFWFSVSFASSYETFLEIINFCPIVIFQTPFCVEEAYEPNIVRYLEIVTGHKKTRQDDTRAHPFEIQ